MLTNYNNYGYYVPLVNDGIQIIDTSIFTKDNISDHVLWIMNILRDGIETEQVQSMKLTIYFSDNYDINLYLPDYFFNLMYWNLFISVPGGKILSKHVYFPENIQNKHTKKYIDELFIEPSYGKLNKIIMNNIINDTLAYFRYVNEFSFYLCNNLSLEDDIKLFKENKEAYDIVHSDLSGVNIEDMRNVSMAKTNRLIDIIKNSDHCIAEMLRTEEGINPKQYRENAVNMGPRSNGEGGIFSIPINSNLLYLGALQDLAYSIIEYSVGRQAQIINNSNVGTSGSFARILKLNCLDTFLHQDPHYICNTKNFIKIEIKNEKILKMFDGMTYRTNPKGLDYVCKEKNKELLGQTLYFRTAMTCASHAKGTGVCHACYGQLAFINSDINIGVMAAEEFSADLTSMLLAAKHLLEAIVLALEWNKYFEQFFVIDCNEISLKNGIDLKNYNLVIDLENDIGEEDELDITDFNHYIEEINIEGPDGNIINISPNKPEHLYISFDLNKIIRAKSKSSDSDIIKIPLINLSDITMFVVNINNDELSEVLRNLQKVIDNAKLTKTFTKDEILQEFVEKIIDSRLYLNATHCATILCNQIRSKDDILEVPDWSNENEEYVLLSVKSALKNTPSITKTLSYSHIKMMLMSPLSFKKCKPSEMDLFYMIQPQEFLNNKGMIENNEEDKIRPAIIIKDKNV